MFNTNDLVTVNKLDQDQQDMLADALETDFEHIEFYFMEKESEHYAILSAEADTGFAIIKCPLVFIDGYYDDSNVVEELFDHILNTLTLDHALDTNNKALFEAIMEHNRAKETKTMQSEITPKHLYLNVMIDEQL